MSLREIITLPNPILRRKAHKVIRFDSDLQLLINDMIETMRAAPGVGLGATQVAESVRLIVVEYGDDDEEDSPKKLYVIANPEIIQFSTDKEMGVEACLSVPGLVGEVERATQIVVKGLNRLGKPTRITAKAWKARIFQHEIDHLDGILYPDRATKVWQPKEGDRPVAAD
jgi:peptide deformylase